MTIEVECDEKSDLKSGYIAAFWGDINELGCPNFCRECKGICESNQDIIVAGA